MLKEPGRARTVRSRIEVPRPMNTATKPPTESEPDAMIVLPLPDGCRWPGRGDCVTVEQLPLRLHTDLSRESSEVYLRALSAGSAVVPALLSAISAQVPSLAVSVRRSGNAVRFPYSALARILRLGELLITKSDSEFGKRVLSGSTMEELRTYMSGNVLYSRWKKMGPILVPTVLLSGIIQGGPICSRTGEPCSPTSTASAWSHSGKSSTTG